MAFWNKKSDEFPSPRHSYDKGVIKDIGDVGWSVVCVPATDDAPQYAFSVGLHHSHQHPEIALIGLRAEIAGEIINQVGAMVVLGHTMETDKLVDDYTNAGNVFKEIDPKYYEEYFGTAAWLYRGNDFPMLQFVWPLRSGQYPWDAGYPPVAAEIQPFLGKELSGPDGSGPVEFSFDELKQLASRDAGAAFTVAKAYKTGNGVAKDEVEARGWLQRAADGGYAAACFHLACEYESGDFGDVEYGKAMQYYQSAAELGYAPGLVGMAELYLGGHGVDLDAQAAFKLYKQAGETGHAVCQAELGAAYEDGKGVDADLCEALRWYQAAAEQGFDAVEPAIKRVQEQLRVK